MKLNSYERKTKLVDFEIETNITTNIDQNQADFFGEDLRPTFKITKLPKDISKEDYNTLLDAEVKLYELNNTMNRLHNDYITTVENYVANVAELETAVEDRSIVYTDESGEKKNIDVLSLWSDINKEYDLEDLNVIRQISASLAL